MDRKRDQMPRTLFRALLPIGLFVFWALPSAGKSDQVVLTIHLPRTGCAAVSPAENVHVSAGPADSYPGDGRPEPTRYSAASDVVRINLTPGYYRIMYSSPHCWEAFRNVVLLPNHGRQVTVTFTTWVVRAHTLYTIFYAPQGAVAGFVGTNVSRVTLQSLSQVNNHAMEIALPTQGAFYFDSVPPGHYRVHVYRSNGQTSRDVTVIKDKAQVLNLA